MKEIEEVIKYLNENALTFTVLWGGISFLFGMINKWFLKNKNHSFLNVVIPIFLMLIPTGIVYGFFTLELPITHISVIIICVNIGLLFMLFMSLSIEIDKALARRIVRAKYGLFEFDHTELPPKPSKDKHR